MYHITLSEEIKRLCPAFQGVAVMAQVTNSAHNAELWREIDAFTRELRADETAESIKQQPAIAATREAYKRCGKDHISPYPLQHLLFPDFLMYLS